MAQAFGACPRLLSKRPPGARSTACGVDFWPSAPNCSFCHGQARQRDCSRFRPVRLLVCAHDRIVWRSLSPACVAWRAVRVAVISSELHGGCNADCAQPATFPQPHRRRRCRWTWRGRRCRVGRRGQVTRRRAAAGNNHDPARKSPGHLPCAAVCGRRTAPRGGIYRHPLPDVRQGGAGSSRGPPRVGLGPGLRAGGNRGGGQWRPCNNDCRRACRVLRTLRARSRSQHYRPEGQDGRLVFGLCDAQAPCEPHGKIGRPRS